MTKLVAEDLWHKGKVKCKSYLLNLLFFFFADTRAIFIGLHRQINSIKIRTSQMRKDFHDVVYMI